MNFGFRYHVASLVAVFFSLILGILIGVPFILTMSLWMSKLPSSQSWKSDLGRLKPA